jgi:putative hydrolase of the HAD superfamily
MCKMSDLWVHVFDLGGVLIFVHEERFYQEVQARCRPDAPLRALFLEHFDRNNVACGGDFDALHPALVAEAGLHMTLGEFRLAWNDMFTPNRPMLQLVDQLPRPRYLLSNTNEPHVAWFHEHYRYVLALFDHCVFSNEVGVRKPDLAIYRHVESLSGRPPGHHVFADDFWENVQGAVAAGWQGIHFTGLDDYRQRLAALKAGS